MLDMFSNLVVSMNEQTIQLNEDFEKIYNEIYDPKSKEDAEDFLDSKNFGTKFRIDLVFKATQDSIRSLEKRSIQMDKVLTKIDNL